MARRNPHRTWTLIALLGAIGLTAALRFGLGFAWPVAWLVAINLAAYPLWAYDKWSSGRGRARVPEKVLHGMALLGATPASFLAMSTLRHKTQKRLFAVLYSVFLVLQVALLLWWMFPPAV